MKSIVVTHRNNGENMGKGDYHACWGEMTHTWECAKTDDEAIGKLIRSTKEELGVEIVHINSRGEQTK